MRVFGLVIGLVMALAAGHAAAQGGGPRFDRGGCDPRYCEESDWIYDDNAKNHTTVWRHGLGVTPRFISILFTADPDRGPVTPLLWPWQWQSTGNPTSVEMGNRMIRLHIAAGPPLHGIWRPEGGWQNYRSGYWKIIVYR